MSRPFSRLSWHAMRVGLPVAGVLLLPDTAQAFPFMVVAAGSGMLPLLGLLLAAVVADRRWTPLLALLVLGLSLLAPGQQVAWREQMRTDSRLLEMDVDERRLIERTALSPAGPERSVALEQVYGQPMLWVTSVQQPLAPGVTLAELLRDPSAHDEDSLFVSHGSGWQSAHAAALTGGRWLAGGIGAFLRRAQDLSPWTGKRHDDLPDCDGRNCLRVAVHLGHELLWNGFARNRVEASVRIEDFIVAPTATLAHLERLSEGGRIPLVFMFFQSSGEEENLEWMALLQDMGVRNAQLMRDIGPIFEGDPVARMESFLGRGEADPAALGLARGCRLDKDGQPVGDTPLTLITSHSPFWAQAVHYPPHLSGCPRLNLPVEGLLPEEVATWVREHAEELKPLRNRRLAGLYLDAPDLFHVRLLGEVLQREGYAWSGAVFGYGVTSDFLEPLRAGYDALLEPLYQRWPGEGRQVSVRILLVAFIGLLLVPALLFVWVGPRWLSVASFVSFVLFCGLGHHAFYRYPLDGWLDPLWAIVPVLLMMLVMAELRRRWQTRPLGKAEGLRRLRRLGLAVPRSQRVRHGTLAAFERAACRIGYPLIFRSDERRRENRDAASMGEHASIVVRTPDDLALLPAAWAAMAAGDGARPGFLAQPFLEFECSGVIRTGLVREGRACLRIESSPWREAVTGNLGGAVESRLLDLEACLCADDPLLREAARICEAFPGPHLLEFGIREGQPVWLQLQALPDHPLLCHGNARALGYVPSPLDDELRGGYGAALLLSLMNASIPFMHWLLQGGRVWQRRTAGFPLFALVAAMLPWRLLEVLSRRLQLAARRRFLSGEGASLAHCRVLLLLDGLVLLKGDSRRIVTWPEDVADGAFAAIASPYAQFAELPELLARPVTTSLPHPPCCRASLLVRERLRMALAYALAPLAGDVRQRLAEQGWPLRTLDSLTLEALRERQLRPAPALLAMVAENAVAPDAAEQGWRCVIDRAEEIEPARLRLAGVVGATVVARRPWMGLFRLVPNVACFEIAVAVHENSHFMQRARLMGIPVVAARNALDQAGIAGR